MNATVTMPIWLFVLIVLFAMVTFASHFLLPSVRWFFRRRLERAVTRLNERLTRPIEPFKLARRYDMIQRLSYDPEVTRAIVEHAQENKVPENVAFQQAQRYAREIVPGFSASLYFGFAIRIARWLSRSLYYVRVFGDNPVATAGIDRNATVVFVMNHRSNMDYVLVTYLIARDTAMAYAVGEWARVWPLSRLIRALGAYFIRRRSRGALYRRVLARYVAMATEGGVTQAMFPEGGLSLTGGLAPPKLGLLKYIIDGAQASDRDVVFVPVGLNYDRVFEDRILIEADRRGGRRFRARISSVFLAILRQVWLAITGRYRRFGVAAVGYGVPLSLKEFQGQHPKAEAEELAHELIQRIGQAVPIAPLPLVAATFCRHTDQTIKDVQNAVRGTLAEIGPKGDVEDAKLLADIDAALVILKRRGFVIETPDGLRANPEEAETLEYYARSIAHLLPGNAA